MSLFIIQVVKIQKILDIQLYCPLSGFRFKNGQMIQPHKMTVMQCQNGALFAKCGNHVARCFVADYPTVKAIMDNATVVRVVKKLDRKESKNVAS